MWVKLTLYRAIILLIDFNKMTLLLIIKLVDPAAKRLTIFK